ncbi:hypothetical protein GF314_00135 [bacterium]|nr:hypothetical protein [bacterium]
MPRWTGLPAIMIVAVVVAVTAAVPASAATDQELIERLGRQLADDDLQAALRTARELVQVRGDLTGAWYNLAGLEAQVGDLARGEEAFARAVQLGYDDFRHADDDPELAPLRETATYRELRSAWRDGLAARAEDRALMLEAGRWSATMRLRDRQGGLTPPEAEWRLRVDADGLDAEILLDGDRLPPTPPWQSGGSGVLLTVGLPASPGEARLHHDFGFGWQQRLPVGARRLGHRWQPLAELSPKMRVDHGRGRLRLTLRLPWEACGTLHPLADDTLLVNVAHVLGHADQPGVAALIDDPGLGRADREWRRGVPLVVRWRDDGPAVAARVDDLVVRDGSAEVTVAATLSTPGADAELHLVLRGPDGEIVHDADRPLDGRRMTTTVPAPPLAGPARLGISLGVGGQRGLASWERTLVVLPDGWKRSVDERIDAAPARERPSLRHREAAIVGELAGRHPRRSVAALGTTVAELEAMLASVDRRGTSVPAGGTYLAIVPGEDIAPPLACSLSLPDGWQHGDASRVVVLLARAPGAAERAVSRAPRLLAELAEGAAPAPVVLVVPHLPPDHDPELARSTAGRLLDWTREFLGSRRIHLAGVDLLAATALELATDRPDELAGVLAITGMNFRPYPDLDRDAIVTRLSGLPAELPVGWIWFPDEIGPGDQGRLMRSVLADRGHELSPRVAVPGGLGFDQAWTRALAWASDGSRD